LMTEVVNDPKSVAGRIPEIHLEDNAKKLADDIEEVCLHPSRNAGAIQTPAGLRPGQTSDPR